MKIERVFTSIGQDVFQTANYRMIDCVIKAADGTIVSSLTNVEVPDHWSQNACDIFAHKYLRKAGVPTKLKPVQEEDVPVWLQAHVADEDADFGNESSVKSAIRRIAGCWAYHGWKGKYFDSEEDARAFFDEIQYMLLHQKCSPNSPQWFNTGLHWAYGIEGKGASHYHYDPEAGEIVQAKTAYKFPQVHACFILDVQDHLLGKNGIMDTWCCEAAIFKYGSGAGANFSRLRASGEPLSGGGKSSGLMSFLKIGDTAAGAIKSGGTTRRAAKMVILDDDHPNIEEFIEWKVKEEQKVLALVIGSIKAKEHIAKIQNACRQWDDQETKFDMHRNPYLKIAIQTAQKAGIALSYCQQVLYALENDMPIEFEEFTYDWNSQAYKVVSGQNSNNSVRVSNKLLKAIKEDGEWELTARTTGEVMKVVNARDLWKKICYSAWISADPGVQYDDTIQSWHTCKASGKITGTNPCSEYVFLSNTACNLASINLDTMLEIEKGKPEFKLEEFQHAARLLTIALEISVQMAQYPNYDFAKQSHDFRTLGLGYASLGSTLMKCGLPYDSLEGRQFAAAITALLTWTSYDASADMAQSLGAFKQYDLNKEHMLGVLENMKKATDGGGGACSDWDNLTGLECLDNNPFLDNIEDVTFCGLKTPKVTHAEKLVKAARSLADQVMKKVHKFGVRNAQTTCIAPTGTISFVMDCGSTSCEPSFALVSWKKLAGGGDMRVLNPEVEKALEVLGYGDKQREEIIKYVFGSGNLADAPSLNEKALLAKGFTQEMIDKMNKQLKNCYHISHVINANLFDRKAQTDLQISADGDLLTSLGFTAQEIHEANLHCCGHLTIEGAPHIKPAHEEIFTCAVNNGVGVKSIKPMGHVKMLAVIQPFISGACSKTVNMPEEATVDDISDVYLQAWAMGVKCIAVYRNNSKFSQPLNVTGGQANQNSDIGIAYRYGMRLDSSPFYILAQENPDTTLAELEIVMGKEGSSFRTLMDCFAKAISLGLSRGIPLTKYIDAFKNTAFAPCGFVEGYPAIKKALSPLDLLARVLEKEYAHREKGHKAKGILQLNQICRSRRATVLIDGHQFTVHTGETEDGRLGEVFFKMSKEGSDFCSLMSSFAKAVSIALQYGMSFEDLYMEFIGTKLEPYGLITGHPQIRSAHSVIDFAFQCLALWYQPELVKFNQQSVVSQFDAKTKDDNHVASTSQSANRACPKCFSFDLKVNGSCYVCSNCGETTGCS